MIVPYMFQGALLIRRPGSACTVILILCRIQKMSAKTPPKIQNPKSDVHKKNCYIRLQNPNPKSKIPRENPKFGALGAPHKELLHQNPKSPKSGRISSDFGFWIGEFWILDSGFWGGPGDVPLGNSVTAPCGQRLELFLVRLWGRCETNCI